MTGEGTETPAAAPAKTSPPLLEEALTTAVTQSTSPRPTRRPIRQTAHRALEARGPEHRLERQEDELEGAQEKRISELTRMAREMGVEGAAGMRKQELIFAVLTAHAAANGQIHSEGVPECLSDGFGSFGPRTTAPSARPRRYLRFAFAASPIQPSYGRYGQRTNPAAQGQ